jgi:hypothetical protein
VCECLCSKVSLMVQAEKSMHGRWLIVTDGAVSASASHITIVALYSGWNKYSICEHKPKPTLMR